MFTIRRDQVNVVAAISIVAVLTLLVLPPGGNAQTLKPKPRDTIVVAIEEDVNTLDPAGGLGTHTLRTMGNAFESLVHSNTTDGSIKPELAKEWKASPDGLEYTFKLRENVKFQDGTPFDAAAVKFSFDRALDKNNPYFYGPYTFPSFFLGAIKEVRVIDNLTVEMILKRQDPTFLGQLVWTTSAVVSPTALKKY